MEKKHGKCTIKYILFRAFENENGRSSPKEKDYSKGSPCSRSIEQLDSDIQGRNLPYFARSQSFDDRIRVRAHGKEQYN